MGSLQATGREDIHMDYQYTQTEESKGRRNDFLGGCRRFGGEVGGQVAL